MNCFARSSDANAGKVAHHRVVEFLAALADAHQQREDRGDRNVRHARGSANGDAFDEGVEDCDLLRTFEVILCLFAGVNSDFLGRRRAHQRDRVAGVPPGDVLVTMTKSHL